MPVLIYLEKRVSHGVIEMLMSVAVVAIMILSTFGVQMGQESHEVA